jgi:multidrug transporter EmrE-like cation transporter
MRLVLLLLANVSANTAAHISLKRSATGAGIKRFLLWQVAGNLAAFLGVLAFTGLLQSMTLHVAYPLTEGVSALGVQIVGSLLIFREKVPPTAWVGTGLILMGIVLFSF